MSKLARSLTLLCLGLVPLSAGCDGNNPRSSSEGSGWSFDRPEQTAATGRNDRNNSTSRQSTPGKSPNVRRPGARSYLHLKPVKVYDRQGWDRPIVARMLLAPVQWKVEGGVRWSNRGRPEDAIQEHFHVSSPDGRSRFEKFAPYRWKWATTLPARRLLGMGGARVGAPLTAKQVFAKVFVPKHRGTVDGVLKSLQSDSKTAAAIQTELRKDFARFPILRNHVVTCDAAVARLQYKHNGTPTEEIVLVKTIAISQPSLPAQTAQFLNIPRQSRTIDYIVEMYAFRAPKQNFEEQKPLFSTMLTSMRQNPGWGPGCHAPSDEDVPDRHAGHPRPPQNHHADAARNRGDAAQHLAKPAGFA